MNNSEGYDSYRIYIWMMAILCFFTFFWLIYNHYMLSSYEEAISLGLRDYKTIKSLEAEIPPQKETEEDEEIAVIENTITFFKRSGRGIEPTTVSGPEKEKQSNDEVEYEDYLYDISFNSITRAKLARYIFYIQQSALSVNVNLKLNSMEIRKIESVAPHEDSWKAELQFIDRHEIPEEEEE